MSPSRFFFPSGSMCGSCKDFRKDCSKLPFQSMRVLKTYKEGDKLFHYVKCSEHKPKGVLNESC